MESYLRIKLGQENLALAMSLGAAAQRGVITAGLVPGRSEVLSASGRVTEVSTPLQLGDNSDLVRSLNNQVRGSFAFSTISTNRVLGDIYAGPPLEEGEPDWRAARCSLYLLNHTLSHDMMTPVWRCPPEYRQRFEVSSIGFVLDATDLDGKEVFWDDFGGLEIFLDLLGYCKQRVASATESLPAASVEAGKLPTESSQAGSLSPISVLAGRTAADGPNFAEPAETMEPLPQAETITRASDSRPHPVADSATAFVSARGLVATDAMVIAKELYGNYLIWCQESGWKPLSQRSFGMRLTGLGFERKRRGRGRHWWVGLGLAQG